MIEVITNHHWRETGEDIPDWDDEPTECFTYRGDQYYLAQFTWFGTAWCPKSPEGLEDWDASLNDTAFSGIVVKLAEGEDLWEHDGMVKVGRFIAH